MYRRMRSPLSNRNLPSLVLGFVIFLVGMESFARSIDENFVKITECDEFFPCQSSGESTVKRAFRENLGVQFVADPPPLPPAPRRVRAVVAPNENRSNVAPKPRPNPKDETKVTSTTGEGGKEALFQKESSQNSQSPYYGGGFGNNSEAMGLDGGIHAGSASSLGSGPELKNRYLYSDDSETQSTGEGASGRSSLSTLAALTGNSVQPTQLNKANNSLSNTDSNHLNLHPNGGSAPTGIAQPTSGNKPRASGKIGNGNPLSQLAEFLKEGLHSFWGGKGEGSHSLAESGSVPMAKGRKASAAKGGAGDKDHRKLLMDEFAKYKRGLANSLEFGGANGFIFEQVCQQYQTYAKSNQINYGQSQCPLN